MKKITLLAGAALLALAVAGCNQENQGGTSDQYGTSSGTNYEQNTSPSTNNYNENNNNENNQGAATSPGGTNSYNSTGGAAR